MRRSTDPVRAGASPAPNRAPGPAGRPRPGQPDTTVAATVALTALTLSVALGFARLFADSDFLAPVVAAAVASHGVAWAGRRRGLPTAVAGLATLVTAALVAAWTVLAESTTYGIPTLTTLRVAADELSRAGATFNQAVAPTPSLPGYMLATVLAIGITAYMADWAAFRVNATFEPCIPAFTLFLFTAALGSSRHRTWAVALFVAAAAIFLLVHEMGLPGRSGSWFGGRAGMGPAALVRTGVGLTALALVGGLVAGPRLPGATDPALVAYKNRQPGSGGSDRATVSPLVDIRGRLVERSGVEVFTVKSTVKAYWRLTSLDTFDGSIWSSNDTYKRARGTLPSDVPEDAAEATQAIQEFRIGALGSIWLPAAYRPERVEGLRGVSYNSSTGSLITAEDLTDDVAYRVQSRIVDLTAEGLAGVPASAPAEINERFLDLPGQSGAVVREAARIVRGATTPYARARALQDHFQSGAFTYDIAARPGHDSRALENFLLAGKRGYCEQFAGAYAVLARLSGLPARVAVGFTPGELQSDGSYHVRDEHAHAWPEVYLDGFGWVAFEPTPGRGAPGAESYTGLPEAQDTSGASTTATTVAPTPTTVAGGDATQVTRPERDEEPVPVGAGDPATGAGALARRLRVVAGAVALLLVAWVVVVPLLWRRHRRRRRTLATTAGGRVMVAWEEVEEALALAGVPRRPAETLTEYSQRAPRVAGLDADRGAEARRLAMAAAGACYGARELDADVVEAAEETAQGLTRVLTEEAGWAERVRRSLDPRLLRSAGRAPRRHGDRDSGADRRAA